MKYTTKNQNEFENLATLHLNAFDKQISQKSNLLDNVDINIKGHLRISSMVCSLSSKQKIVAPMTCLYLLQGGPFYEFHKFVMLFMKHLLNILMNANIVEVSIIRSINGDVVIYTPTTIYSCHLDSVEHLSFYEFTSTFKNIVSIKQLPFKKPHLQKASHSCIINVFKVQLSDIAQEDLGLEKHFSYFRTLLMLHKRFRYLNDLLGDDIAWEHAFQSHNQFVAMQAYIEHCEDYNVGK